MKSSPVLILLALWKKEGLWKTECFFLDILMKFIKLIAVLASFLQMPHQFLWME